MTAMSSQSLARPLAPSLAAGPLTLPECRGRLRHAARLAPLTWFRVGGEAAAIFEPVDLSDLQAFLAALPTDIPILPLGFGSNLLVRDGGFSGVVIRLLRPFSDISITGQHLTAGAGVADRTVAMTAARHGLAGLEFFSGIPGMIGGALRMNSGAYGSDVASCVRKVRAVDRSGKLHRLDASEITFGYRSCDVPEDWVFVDAEFEGVTGAQKDIEERMDEIARRREESQPIRERTGGSTFANPTGHRAWELVDAVGGRGRCVGDAQFSEQHANFMINRGAASAFDLEALGEQVRRDVRETFEIDLRWEIKRVGDFATEARP